MRPHRLRRVGSALTIAGLALTVLPASVWAGQPIAVNVIIGAPYVSGTGVPNASYVVTLRNADHEFKGRVTVGANGNGFWIVNSFTVSIDTNDTIKVDGPNTRTVTVPRLTVVADRVANTISGLGPASSTVSASALHCLVLGNQCSGSKNKSAPTDGTGHYSAGFAAFDPRGGDYWSVYWTSPDADTITTIGYFPYIEVWRNQARLNGIGRAGALVTATVKTAANVLRGTARAVVPAPAWFFDTTFRNSSVDPVNVHSTDKVSADIASDAHFTMPAVTVAGDAATNVVSGTCPANRPLQLNAYDPAYARPDPSTTAFGMANGAGSYSINVTTNEPTFNLTSGDRLEVICDLATGDAVARLGITP